MWGSERLRCSHLRGESNPAPANPSEEGPSAQQSATAVARPRAVPAPREPPSTRCSCCHPRSAHPVAALHVPLQRLRRRLIRAAPHDGLRRRPALRSHRGGAARRRGTRGRVRLLQRRLCCHLSRRCGGGRRLRRRRSLPAFGLRRDRALRRRLSGSLRRAVRCLLRPTRRRPARVGHTCHRRERHLILELPHLGVHLELLGPRHLPVELVVDPMRARRHGWAARGLPGRPSLERSKTPPVWAALGARSGLVVQVGLSVVSGGINGQEHRSPERVS